MPTVTPSIHPSILLSFTAEPYGHTHMGFFGFLGLLQPVNQTHRLDKILHASTPTLTDGSRSLCRISCLLRFICLAQSVVRHPAAKTGLDAAGVDRQRLLKSGKGLMMMDMPVCVSLVGADADLPTVSQRAMHRLFSCSTQMSHQYEVTSSRSCVPTYVYVSINSILVRMISMMRVY